MVQIGTSDSERDLEGQADADALAGSAAEHVSSQRRDLARLDRLVRIQKQIKHLMAASDRLATAPLPDHTALPAMDRINYEIEVLSHERDQLQIEQDLSLAETLELTHRRAAMVEALLNIPDEAIPEALWALYEDVEGDPVAFADVLGIESSNSDAQYLFDLVSTTIGDRP